MKLPKLEIFSSDEIKEIHNASMQILEEIGINVEDPGLRISLNENGAIVADDSPYVKFPNDLVKEKLKLIPDSFVLHGRDGDFTAEVNTHSTQYATIGTPVRIYDPEHQRGVRKTVLTDTINQIRIVDSLKNIICSHVDVWPHDVPYLELHCHVIKAWAQNSTKPYGLGCFGRLPSQDMMDLLSIIVGGKNELITHPRLIGFFSITSPLSFSQLMTNGFEVFAKYKQPTILAPEALAGSTAPITLAGLLAQTNAEILAGAVLAQIYNPRAPVLYGTVSHITDMRTGNSAMGSVETGLITAGIAQLGRYYNIPSRGPGAVTDSKLLDMQNGFERYQTLMLAAQAGCNYITCAGSYEATLAEALELLVIDDELVSMIKHTMEGIEVNENTIGLEAIQRVVRSEKKGANFLDDKHTLTQMRTAHFLPALADRNRRTSWRKKGSKDIVQRAREKVNSILEIQRVPPLAPEKHQAIDAFMKKVSKRSYEYYKETEGMMDKKGTVTIDHVEISEDSQKK
ncbi:MAG: trimethylamine methyltransferase family protein [Candidatus Lokiarchaeota archaeon]|nr:trimethylamine methyltransferase family protein [Candidatus Lokiarchaeota archaeon]